MSDAAETDSGGGEPDEIEVTATPPRRGRRWTVSAGARTDRVDPDDRRDLRRAARELAVPPERILFAIQAAEIPEEDAEPEIDPLAEPTISGWNTGEPPRASWSSLGEALDAIAAADRGVGERFEFLGWGGAGSDQICAVDVDLTREAEVGGFRFTEADVERQESLACPVPRYSWLSRSGGYRGIFGRCSRYGLSAVERAGLWVLRSGAIVRHVAVGKTELVAVTRPPTPGAFVMRSDREYGVQDMVGALRRSGGREAASEESITAWLDAAGMRIGERFDHDLCPYAPDLRGGREPVVVSEAGVRCWRCGIFRGWAALVDPPAGYVSEDANGGLLDPLAQMATEFVHWTHARRVIEAERPNCDPPFLRAGYAALLKVLHWDKRDDVRVQKRIRALWSPDLRYVRSRGLWVRSDDFVGHVPSRSGAAELPWTGGRANRVDLALGDANLPGYVPIEPVLHLVDKPTWRGDTVLVPQPVRLDPDVDDELTLEQAWEQLRQALPGVTDDWLRASFLLTVAGLRAQLRLASPPTIAVRGASGAGKGAMAAFVSGVLGKQAAQLHFDGSKELGMAIGQGLERRAPLLFGDEIGKAESWWAQSAALLRLGPVHEWRKLHAGYVQTPVRSAIVLAGSTFPAAFWGQRELVRRVAVVQLSGLSEKITAGWEAQARAFLGVPRLEDLRTSTIGCAIAQAYVLAARAEVLRPDLPDWVSQAVELGAQRLSESEAIRERADVVRGLYRIWREGPDEAIVAAGARAGWLRCWPTGVADEAAQILAGWIEEAWNERGRNARFSELETDEVVPGVQLQIRARGQRACVRFQRGNDRSLDRRDPALFPPPEDDNGR